MSVIDEIFKKGLQRPNRVAIMYGKKKITYNQYILELKNLGEELKKCGIRKRDIIGYIVNDPFEFMICSMAFNFIGAVVVPIESKQGKVKIRKIVEKYRFNYIFGEKPFMNEDDTSKKFKYEGFELYYNKTYDHTIHLPKDVEFILLTSGTTSIPKAVMLTKRNILSTVESVNKYLKIHDEDSVLIYKSLTHSSTFVAEFLLSLYSSITIYISNLIPTYKSIKYQIDKYNITILFTIPEMLKGMQEDINTFKRSSLRVVSFSGSMVSSELISNLVNKLPNINFINAYGQTEASPRITYIDSMGLKNRPNSVGRPLPTIHIRVVNKRGKECKYLEIGEIVVKGPNVMQGYLGETKKNKETIRNGELYTKDLGYIDEDGFLYITGRTDNMFIINGRNIYPEEIESVILTEKSIKECLVKNNQNSIAAYITINEKYNFNETKFLNRLKNGLEYYKIPNKVYKVEEIKKNHNNKVIRNQIFNKFIELM